MICLRVGDGEGEWSDGLNDGLQRCWLFVVLRGGWQAPDTEQLK